MKWRLLMLGLVFLPTLAMAAPNFNGTWILNNANSDPNPYPQYWTTRSGSGFMGRRPGEVLINIHQDARSVQLTDPQTPIRDYILDGKPHSRSTDTEIEKATVTAEFQGDNLVVETTQPFGGMPGNVTLTEKEVWSLSPDGKTLTITTTRSLPARTQTFKQVYNRTQTQPVAICSAGCVALP